MEVFFLFFVRLLFLQFLLMHNKSFSPKDNWQLSTPTTFGQHTLNQRWAQMLSCCLQRENARNMLEMVHVKLSQSGEHNALATSNYITLYAARGTAHSTTLEQLALTLSLNKKRERVCTCARCSGVHYNCLFVCLFVCVLFVYVMMHGGFLFFVHLLFEIFVDGQ